MARLGSRARPAIVRVQTETHAQEIVAVCQAHGWQVIAGVEPDAPEDVSDVHQLLAPDQGSARRPPAVGRNARCPCGSGRKYKKCCLPAAGTRSTHPENGERRNLGQRGEDRIAGRRHRLTRALDSRSATGVDALPGARAGPDRAKGHAMSERPVLWQFTASHFNEKVRWALDWKGMAYERRSLLPGLHLPRALLVSRQRSVPVLVLDGAATADSTRIIEALERRRPDPPLYPAEARDRDRALALEEFFDEELGPHIRRAFFHEVLHDADYVSALFTQDSSPLARRFYRAIFPGVRAVMKMDMRIDAGRAAASRAKVEAALERIEREVGPSGHLVGDRFTVADLTAAALFVPLVQPPEFPYAWPAPIPEPAARWRAALAPRRGFRWVEETYRRYRRAAA